MKNIAENNVIRFTNISQKKEGIFANFKVKALCNGVTISASISVDITVLELDTGSPLEKIVEECAKMGHRELKKINFTFEGLDTLSSLDSLALSGV